METKAIMFDVETLSTKPNAYVTQIGFCAAILETREYLLAPRSFLTIYLPVEQKNADIEFETVAWWVQQKDAITHEIFVESNAKRRHRFGIFEDLQVLINGLGTGTTIWASPAMFDMPVLFNYFNGRAWNYRVERDLKTLACTFDPDGNLKPPPNPLKHNAAADAGWQMEYLMNLWAVLPVKAAKPA